MRILADVELQDILRFIDIVGIKGHGQQYWQKGWSDEMSWPSAWLGCV